MVIRSITGEEDDCEKVVSIAAVTLKFDTYFVLSYDNSPKSI